MNIKLKIVMQRWNIGIVVKSEKNQKLILQNMLFYHLLWRLLLIFEYYLILLKILCQSRFRYCLGDIDQKFINMCNVC